MIGPVIATIWCVCDRRQRAAVSKSLEGGKMPTRSESRSQANWLSASILHDLRNPVGTIYAGAEILMTLDAAPNQVKRLAANMHHAAGRSRELLIELASASCGT